MPIDTLVHAFLLWPSSQAGFLIAPVTGQLGVDNITASAVPEPATAFLLISGFAGLAVKLRKRGRA